MATPNAKGGKEMNRVILSGRWSREIELRFTPNGTAVSSSAIAVDDGWGDKKQTHFFEIEAWSKLAESAATYSDKGLRVLIEGRLKQEKWEKDGQKRSFVKVVAERIEFIDFKEKQNQQQSQSNDPFVDDGKPIEIDDSDLPF